MPVPTIAVFVGSLRRESCNRRLALALEKLAGDRARFQYVRIDDLPLYNQDFDGSYPAQGTRLKDEVRGADAVLFVTPEYNRSVPGVLNIVKHEIELTVDAADIPSEITVSLKGLEIGSTIHIADVTLPKGATAAAEGDVAIATLVPPTVPTAADEQADAEIAEAQSAEAATGEDENKGE